MQFGKLFVIVVGVVVCGVLNVAAVPAANTALGDLAAAMAEGTWAELSTLNISPTLSNTGGSDGMILPYTDTSVWDPVSRQIFFIGGDHNPASCYPRFVSYSEASNAWQILPQPSWFKCTAETGGTPMHGYNHNAIDPVHGKLYHRPFNDPVIRKYDIASQTWTALPPVTSAIQYVSVAVGVAWFPERNSLVYASIESGTNGAVVEYDETQGQWRRIAGNLPMGGYQNFAKYDPVHKVVLFGGGAGSRRVYKLDAAGQVTALNDAPIPLGIENSIITADPVSGKYLVFGNLNDFYVYDVVQDVWTLQPGPVPAIFATAGYVPPVHGIMAAPLSSHGLNAFVKCRITDCRVYLYKHYSDVTPPAIVFSSPAAGAVLSGTLTISANATDEAGGSGVSAVQFKLDGADFGAEDTAAPFAISWNTTTALNGSHTLTAVARDAAGNQTTSAPITVSINNGLPFNFSLSAGGDEVLTQGQFTARNISIAAQSGAIEQVSLSISGLPPAASAQFVPSFCIPGCDSTMTVSTSAATPPGTYPVTITGTATSSLRTVSFLLVVSPINANFTDKCGQPGVLNCFGFDDTASLHYSWPAGTVCDAAFAGQPNHDFGQSRNGIGNTVAVVQNGQCVFPQRDTALSHSGGAALKIRIPSQSGPDSGGFFSEPFKRNANGTFASIAPGSPLGNVAYFQFYQRFDPNFLSTDFQCVNGICSGFKQAIWYGAPPNGSSSSSLELTQYNGWQRNLPQMYGQQGFDDYGVQDVNGCTYAKATSLGGSGSGFNSRANYSEPLNPACIHYAADQWMEFTGRVEIGSASNTPTSRVQLWVNGQLAIDNPHARINWTGADGDGLGQFLLSPYHTGKDLNQVHPEGATWYDDVIVSTQPIAMLNGAIPGPGTNLPDPNALSLSNVTISNLTSGGATVTWTTDKAADAHVDYGTTASYGLSAMRSVVELTHTLNLVGLAPSTTYHFRVKSRDAANNLATGPDMIFTTPAPADVTPPVISGVVAGNLTAAGATLTWFTNEASDSQVEYGVSPSYGNQSAIDTARVTSHFVTLSGLQPGTEYNYRVKSRDAAGNLAVSVNSTFRTAQALGNGLIGYWAFDEGAGLAALDTSGGNRNGALSRAPLWVAGKLNSGLQFNATDNANDDDDPRVIVGPAFDVTGVPLTISVWVNPADYNDYRAIFSKRDTASGSRKRFDFVLNRATGTVSLQGISNHTFPFSPPLNTWTHLAIVAGTTDTRLYVNGALHSTSGAFVIGTNATANTVIGGTGEPTGGDNDPYKGKLDEVRVYNRALAPAEVTQLFSFVAPDVAAPTISGIAVSSISAAAASIAWTTDEQADTQVEYGLTSSYGLVTTLNPALLTAHSQSLSGLASSTTYHFRVRSRDAAGNLALSADMTFDTPDVTAPAMSAVTVSNITGSSATIAWTTDEAADTQVEYGLTASYGSITPLNASLATAHSVVLSGLTSKTTYHFRVRSRDAAGNLATTADATFATPDVTPPVISAVAVSSVTESYATIGWTTDEPSDSQIEYGATASYGEGTPLSAALVSTHNIVVTGLTRNTTYHFRVRSKDAAGNLATGSDGTFTTPDTTPPVISAITMSGITGTSATVAWTTDEPADTQLEYGLDVGYGQTSPLNSSPSTTHSVTLAGLSSGTTYHFRVLSKDAAGNPAASADATLTTLDVTAPIISSIAVSNVTGTAATVTWTTNEPADTQVEYGPDASYGLASPLNSSPSTTHSVTLAGLSSGTTYHFRVLSKDAAGNPAASTDATFTTLDVTAPVISAITVSNVTGTTATIAWTTNEPADTQVQYGLDAGYGLASPLNSSPLTTHSVTLGGLSSSTTYHFRVLSKDAAGNPAASGDAAFTTLDVTAPVISSITAVNITGNGATISWTTDEPSDTQVEYGVTLSYGQSASSGALVSAHSQTLSGLTEGTLYNYRVLSRDAAGNLATSGNFTFTTAPPSTLSMGLLGYWPFDEGSGLIAADVSGNNKNGTLSRNPLWTAGRINGALQFNATDNGNDDDDPRVIIGPAFDVTGVPFTIAAWVNPTDYNDYRAIFSKRDTAASFRKRFDLVLNRFTGRVALQGISNHTFAYSPPLNTWTHLVIVAGATDTRLYVNGVLQSTSGAFTIGTNATATTVIGGTGEGAGGDNDPYKGKIDEVRVYNRALSVSEVQQLFNLGGASASSKATAN